ncbi:zinc finger protein 737-like [Rhagoletis pomonella]|uniref:zinc finger protein 737-like n=1 Tax=Rhagoletis pomonella TaxID=28610 RepID=UPI0017838A63|nr:zinc finger protein 737-like [Rhagoletis pomonella]
MLLYMKLTAKKYLDFLSVRLKHGTLKETPTQSILQNEEKAFVQQIEHASVSNMPEIHLREDRPHESNQVDEVTCVFEDEGAKDEDPFVSDIDADSTESTIISKRKRSYKNVCIYETKESHEHKYCCSNCSLCFQRLGNYRIHMKKRHGVILEPITCPQCPKTFKNKYDLNRHIVKHRPLSETRIFPCPQCDRKFQTKAYVAKHIKFVHEDIRPFICEECGEATRTEATLREHMLTHTDLAPFECEICKKGFKNPARLKNHMDIHNSNKHICSECGLKLNSRVTLNQHMLVHSDTMRHKCDYCGRAFKRAKTLKNHLILHSGLKPYSCQFCERTFTNGSNCRTHMKRAHPSELAELEASGKRTCTKNIPKLAALKSVIRVPDHLISK